MRDDDYIRKFLMYSGMSITTTKRSPLTGPFEDDYVEAALAVAV